MTLVRNGDACIHSLRATAAPVAHIVVNRRADLALLPAPRAPVDDLVGARLEEPRHIWWNFVSSSQERIERAKRDWREGRFPKVPGDEAEFIPLPE